MKKILIFTLVGILCAISSCTAIVDILDLEDNNGEYRTEFVRVASENPATKVSLTGNNYGWTASDRMAFFITNDEGASYLLQTSDYYDNGGFSLTYASNYKRKGYAVIPDSFATSLSGSTLTVTYPDSYDISAQIDAGSYDNASLYLPAPMVAVSDVDQIQSQEITFYSIGALVKVVMSNIPVGTKKLFVTFNQVVTGDFVVSNPGTATSSVSVSDKANSSTVAFTISASGLTAEQATHSIVLYIPVPTTTGLSIASSTTTKANVERNKGYVFEVDAITRVSNTTDFKVGSYNYILSPGNLLAHNNGGNIEWSFLSGLDQLKTVTRNLDNDRHVQEYAKGAMLDGEHNPIPFSWQLTAPSLEENGYYKDVFGWEELYQYWMGEAPDPNHDFGTAPSQIVQIVDGKEKTTGVNFTGNNPLVITTGKTISGNLWYIPSPQEFNSLIFNGTELYSPDSNPRDGILACVAGTTNARMARGRVLLDDTAYANYAMVPINLESPDPKYTNGLFLFPDGYVDQTGVFNPDYINDISAGLSSKKRNDISYSAFEKMVAAGVIFIPCAGQYYLYCTDSYTIEEIDPDTGKNKVIEVAVGPRWYGSESGYYFMNTSYIAGSAPRMIINASTTNLFYDKEYDSPRSVRLIRKEGIN